jgi:hypothetical protein
MPAVNLYFSDEKYLSDIDAVTDDLKQFVAKKLTCKEITLGPQEVSIRLLPSAGKGMLAKVELDIFAAPYPERIENQDQICLDVRQFLLDKIDDLDSAMVWLILSELGHSL